MSDYITGEIMKPEFTSAPKQYTHDNAKSLVRVTNKISSSSRSKGFLSKTAVAGFTAAIIMASISTPAFATTSETLPELSAVSLEDSALDSPILPVTPRPDPTALSPEAADNSIADAIAEAGSSATKARAVSPDSVQSDKFANQVFTLMNEKRRAAGAPALKWNQSISNVSQDWANKLRVATADPNFDWNAIHRADGGGSLIDRKSTRLNSSHWE